MPPHRVQVPRVVARCASPARILPLRFRRQRVGVARRQSAGSLFPLRQLRTKRHGLVPTDLFHRRVPPGRSEVARVRAHHRLILALRHRRPPNPEWMRQRHPCHRAFVVAVGPQVGLFGQLLPHRVVPFHHRALFRRPHQKRARRDVDQVEVQVGDRAGIGGPQRRRRGRFLPVRQLDAEIPCRPAGDDERHRDAGPAGEPARWPG